MNLYGPLLEKVLFPAFETARGRPTVPLLQFLRGSERWSADALRDLQAGLLRRLIRHAATHMAHYHQLLGQRGLVPEDFATVDDLRHLPVVERSETGGEVPRGINRELARETLEARTAGVPRWVIKKSAGGALDAPVVVRYGAESRHWCDATRWRGYGWAGYRIGMRALRYWGDPPSSGGWLARRKQALDRMLKRNLHIDCTVRSERALASTARRLREFQPQVIVADAAGAAALARYVNDNGLRTWADIPVVVGAERLWPHDRNQIQQAFGPAFETYGCGEGMMIAAECEAHDGMHTAMENLIVEVIVRGPDGAVRAAQPGEVGEVAITDLHNLACPMIRYVTGDLAVARADRRCACGRGLVSIDPIDGRVTEAVTGFEGPAVAGMGEIPLTSAGQRGVVLVEPGTRTAAGSAAMLA
jgi:phenylacetate-CoA ligase